MKKIFLSTIVAIGLSSALYAGGNVVAPPEVPIIPVNIDSWSGPYLGVSGGYLKGHDDFESLHQKKIELGKDGFKTTIINPKGFEAGIFVGYNKLLKDNYILGIEGIFNFTKVDDENWIKTLNGETTNTKFNLEQKNEAALYLRAGKVIDNKYMPYVLVGGSYTNLYGTLSSPTQSFKNKSNKFALTSGAGLEVNLNKNWNIRFQYRYTNYGDVKFNYNISNVPVNVKIKYNTHTFKAGLSYRFN